MRPPTYIEIQAWVKLKHGWEPKTCWIAHCKELLGLIPPNKERKNPCPPKKREAIFEAIRTP